MRAGQEFWVTRDYGGEGKALNLSKARLGEFMYHLLKMGGRVTDIHVMNAEYDRCYCQAAISLPAGQKEEFERISGFILEKPPVLSAPRPIWPDQP
jgi:hypothetical protein